MLKASGDTIAGEGGESHERGKKEVGSWEEEGRLYTGGWFHYYSGAFLEDYS
jgi:hypothetical protein